MGGLDPAAASLAETQFDALVTASFHVFAPNSADFNLARRFLRNYDSGLRAGDALHLAIAFNREVAAIYSLDQRLITAGTRLGLPKQRGIATDRRKQSMELRGIAVTVYFNATHRSPGSAS